MRHVTGGFTTPKLERSGFLRLLQVLIILLINAVILFAAAGTLAAIRRSKREDQVLQAELPGYAAYAQRDRYRLAPGIW